MADETIDLIDDAIEKLNNLTQIKQNMIDNIRIQILNYVKNADMALDMLDRYINLTHCCHIELKNNIFHISYSTSADGEEITDDIIAFLQQYFELEIPTHRYEYNFSMIAIKRKL